jgi:hypothetical protein
MNDLRVNYLLLKNKSMFKSHLRKSNVRVLRKNTIYTYLAQVVFLITAPRLQQPKCVVTPMSIPSILIYIEC